MVELVQHALLIGFRGVLQKEPQEPLGFMLIKASELWMMGSKMKGLLVS